MRDYARLDSVFEICLHQSTYLVPVPRFSRSLIHATILLAHANEVYPDGSFNIYCHADFGVVLSYNAINSLLPYHFGQDPNKPSVKLAFLAS